MEELLRTGTAFLRTNPVVAGALGLVLLYLLIRKTKLLLYLLLLAAVLGAVFSLIGDLAGKGSASKTRMINQTGTRGVE